MNLLSLPDIVGMLFLMGALGWLWVRQREERVGTWMIGLSLVLLETCVTAALHKSPRFLLASDVVRLDAYLLAGLAFSWAARQDLVPGSDRLPLFLLPAAPLLVLTTMLGLGVSYAPAYQAVCALALLAGQAYILLAVRRRPRFKFLLLAVHMAIWLPMLVFAIHARPHATIYWGLAAVYTLIATAFRGRIRKDSVGGFVLVAAFATWAGCFLVYPLVHDQPAFEAFIEETWKIQKFLVILGMLLTLLEDETRRRREEALHDALTGLPNRRLYQDRLQQALERANRTRKLVGLFVLDLNGFKAINDQHGHRVGDDVLRRAARRLEETVRGSDTLARCGGDEFCVVVNDLASRADCETVAAALRKAIDRVELPAACDLKLSGSVGFAVFPLDAEDQEQLNELADVRMYREKRLGAGTVLQRPLPTPA